MFNKLNKHLIPTNPAVVNEVGVIWEMLLPDRLPMPDEGNNGDEDDDRFVGSDAKGEESILKLGDDDRKDDV
ncbi:hypothetical protein KSP39_PZI022334 [Platanthera zijinensis]|uniref:Uncharacterized protein n=1 Tax=Platanthera zijinensis TaxID=2320716 RepID=A0AAP0FV81_9ASPA